MGGKERMLKRLIVVCTLGIFLLSGCAEASRFVEQAIAVLQEEAMVINERAASEEALAAPEPTPGPVGLSEEELAEFRPNEIGWVLVLEYHLVYPGEDNVYNRTPASFRADLEWLHRNDYYPIRFRDLTAGTIDIPAGKSPVVLTFDDSDISQYRVLDDGSVDPESAMGVLMGFAEEHPDFPPVAVFFPLLDVDAPQRILFGQPEYANQKLQTIVALGGEVGSHSVSHERLDLVSEARVRWQLAFSSKWLAERIGDGYEIVSLSIPFGAYPANLDLIRSGESEGVSYAFTGAAEVAGGAALSPYAEGFRSYHIARAQVVPGYIESIYATFENRPTLKYVADGDPNTITVPTEETLDPEQRGIFDEARWADEYEIVRYERR
jgi:peptidoglycan/xylan/chitin deacetylase (PgdA/CDA1 family)